MDTLSALLATGAARQPDMVAVTDEAVAWDWSTLLRRADAVAAQLAGLGVQPGARVGLWMPNCADYLAAIFGVARLGALAIHINTRFRAAEVGDLLRRSRAVALVTDLGFAAVDFAAILAELPPADRATLRHLVARRMSGPTSRAGLPVQPLATAGDIADAAAPERPCLTFTTSGTTSGPKLVLHSQRVIARHAVDVMRATGLDRPGSALLAAVPLCGTLGNVMAMAAIAGSAPIVCMERFDGAGAVALIRRHAISHTVGGDDMMARIIEAAGGTRFSTMRLFGYAAFTATSAVTVAQGEALGLFPTGFYGSSEVQAAFSVAEGTNRLRPGGTPSSPQAEVSIRDPETGVDLPRGQSGELCFRAPSLFVEYLDNAAATARSRTADGFFRSGDLGHLDGTGFIYEARLGDTLRLGGFLVNPEEIEAFLASLPGVDGAQVVAAPRAGEPVPVAFVTARPGAALDPETLLAACRARIARFKVPARLEVIDAFPVTESPNGTKIQRIKLRERAVELLSV